LPQNVAERRLIEYYKSAGLDPRNKMPFPGRQGRIWECPSAIMDDSAFHALDPSLQNGINGFFSYDFNIDLKKKDANGGNYIYPAMPRLGQFCQGFRHGVDVDVAFNPITEVVNGSPGFNSANPANRFKASLRGITRAACSRSCDGHALWYRDSYITNGADFRTRSRGTFPTSFGTRRTANNCRRSPR